MAGDKYLSLEDYLAELKRGEHKFETAAEAVARMILEGGFQKKYRGGKLIYDFNFFRQGKKPVVGLYEEIEEFVNFVKDAAEGGSAAEMAFVLIGEPGNGKTFFVDYVCDGYRRFISHPKNRRYTFDFICLDKLGGYGNLKCLPSQTLEDPVILAMNLFEDKKESREYLATFGFSEVELEDMFRKYRPLGASSEHVWLDILNYTGGDIKEALKFVRVLPAPVANNMGIPTGKFSPLDKITSSAADLVGEESLDRILNLSDPMNPYRYDLRKGALARAGGGGIHFADEFFRNKPDLIQIYLQVIQNRVIEISGYRWPVDTLILATSNVDVWKEFISLGENAPIKDRCYRCFVGHNTDYKVQRQLTRFILAASTEDFSGAKIHEDPNLEEIASMTVVLTRLPDSERLTPTEMMRLEAGEVAGDKSPAVLQEIKDELNASVDISRRWGQNGVGQRGYGRAFQVLEGIARKKGCKTVLDFFSAFERMLLDDYVERERSKYFRALETARQLYRKEVRKAIFNAYRDDPAAIERAVLSYVYMAMALDSGQLGPEKTWQYRDPRSGELKVVKLDERYVEAVEHRLGLKTNEERKSFRSFITKIWVQKTVTDPNYNFIDQEQLVNAVTEVTLESDIAGAGSLVAALANLTDEKNIEIQNSLIERMIKMGYCKVCAQLTIEYFCTKEDEN